jgi:hypothetical protein
MTTLAIAFASAWGAVALYLGWLAHQNRRLGERLAALESAALDKQSSRRQRRAA